MKLIKQNGNQIIGVTGKICSGKSFVLSIFNKMGFEIFKFDDYTKHVINKNKKIQNYLKKNLLSNKDNIDDYNLELKNLIIKSPEKIIAVEKLLQPIMIAKFNDFRRVKKSQTKSIIVESALIYEKQRQNFFDKIIYVTTDDKIREKRFLERGNNKIIYELINKKQKFSNSVLLKSDFIIYSYNKLSMIKQINKIIHGNASFARSSSRYRNNWVRL